jgi:hypothetical protein
VSERTWEGDPLDGTVQYLGEAPYWRSDDGETVAVVDDEETGEVRTEDIPDAEVRGPDEPGQSTLTDYTREWSL